MLAPCSGWATLGPKWLAMRALLAIGVRLFTGPRSWEEGGCSLGIGPCGQGRLRQLADLGWLHIAPFGWLTWPILPIGGWLGDWFRPLPCRTWLVGLARVPLSLLLLFASVRVQCSVARDRVWRLLSFQLPVLSWPWWGPWAQQGFVPAVGPGLQRSPGPLLRFPSAPPGIGRPVTSSKGCD